MSSTDLRTRNLPSVLLASILAISGTHAVDTVFDPSVELTYGVDGNPDVVEDTGETKSDDVAGIAVDLNVRFLGQTTSAELAYRPYYQAYADDSDRDFLGHRVNFNLDASPSRRSKIGLGVRASSSERQGLTDDASAPTTLVPRRKIERASVALSQSILGDKRLSYSWSLGVETTRFKDVEASGVQLEDSSAARVGVGFRHATTRKVAVGLDATAEVQEYDTREDTAVIGLAAAIDVSAGRFTSWTFSAGYQQSETDFESQSSPYFEIAVDREVTRRSSLGAAVRQSVSRGTGLAGPTVDLGAFLEYSVSPGQRWGFETRIGYWEREELELDVAEPVTVDSLLSTTSISWNVTDRLSLGVQHQYQDQSSDSPADPVVAAYHSGGVFLRLTARRRE